MQAVVCSYFMFLSFNIMEPIFSIRSSSFLCLYHSEECCEDIETNLFLFSVALSFRRMLQVFQDVSFLFWLVRFFLNCTWWQAWRSGWRWFETIFRIVPIMQKMGGKQSIFFKRILILLKKVHRNCAFKSHSSSIGVLIKTYCFFWILLPKIRVR